jgi:hypothetical protein
MTFKINASYMIREKRMTVNHSVPVGTFEDFKDRVTKLLEYYGDKPGFKFSASFG